MTHFIESDLHFYFNDQWLIKKYDNHRFYRHLSGVGLKAVDFIGLWKGKKVILMEIKNYKTRYTDHFPPIGEKILAKNPTLVALMENKIEDTFLAIETIIKYYQRRWWYRIFVKIIPPVLPRYFQYFEWGFWTCIHQKIQDEKENVQLVLWLELEDKYPNISKEELQKAVKNLQTSLNDIFNKYSFYVFSTEHHHFGVSIRSDRNAD